MSVGGWIASVERFCFLVPVSFSQHTPTPPPLSLFSLHSTSPILQSPLSSPQARSLSPQAHSPQSAHLPLTGLEQAQPVLCSARCDFDYTLDKDALSH